MSDMGTLVAQLRDRSTRGLDVLTDIINLLELIAQSDSGEAIARNIHKLNGNWLSGMLMSGFREAARNLRTSFPVASAMYQDLAIYVEAQRSIIPCGSMDFAWLRGLLDESISPAYEQIRGQHPEAVAYATTGELPDPPA